MGTRLSFTTSRVARYSSRINTQTIRPLLGDHFAFLKGSMFEKKNGKTLSEYSYE